MDTTTQFTRCPNCKTAFKVTEQLLAKAGGKVRCGACLEIFKATDYLLKPSQAANSQTANSQSKAVQAQQPQSSSTTMVRDMVEDSLTANKQSKKPLAFDADKIQLQDPVDPPAQTDETETAKPERKPTIEFDASVRNNPFERLIPSEEDLEDTDDIDFSHTSATRQTQEDVDFNDWIDEEFKENDVTPDQDEMDDEIISDELKDLDNSEKQEESIRSLTQEINALLDLDDEPEQDPKTVEKTAKPPKDPAPKADKQITAAAADTSNATNYSKKTKTTNKDNATDLHEDAVFEHDVFEDEGFEIPLNEKGEPQLGQTQSIFFDETMLEKFSEQDEEEQAADASNSSADEEEDDDDIISIEEYEQQMGIKYNLNAQLGDDGYEPDPLDEFDSVVKDFPSELRSKLIMGASALLVIILLVQIWSNRQAIAWSDTWGGAMKTACAILPCDLKPRRDVSKIKLLQRQVSPDEELEETLDIKVMFVNQAGFEQPYPNIKIIFSDSNNNPVATKTFTPADYLKNSNQQDLMPVNTEVHIEFKTDLDYPDALGFEFIFE